MQPQKWQNDLGLFPKQALQHDNNSSVCPTTNPEEAEVDQFYEDLEDLLELTPKNKTKQKTCSIHHLDLECKIGSQEIPGLTGKFGLGEQNEGQRLTEFCQEKALVIANTLFQQHKRQLYTWKSSNGQYPNQIDNIFCIQSWRSCIQSAKTRCGAVCDSDHWLLIAKFKLKLKKARKTTRPVSYNLNQIRYEYTVEVANRWKGLDLINSMPEELWTEVCNIVPEAANKTISKKKKSKKAKWLSEKVYK